MRTLEEKIADLDSLEDALGQLKRPIVFTNGCFDIIHRGHVTYLQQARNLGQSVVVGVNTDASVRQLNKGGGRPINVLSDRMAVLAALETVDLVVAFDEATPLELINRVRPDHQVKGGDWKPESIVGADEVLRWGGQVHSIPIEYERSTTSIIDRIRS